MTVVTEVEGETVGTSDTEPRALYVPASELGRVLHNVGLFASKEQTRPVLCCVRLRVEHDAGENEYRLTATATDSYKMAEESCAADDGHQGNRAENVRVLIETGDILIETGDGPFGAMVKALTKRTAVPLLARVSLEGQPEGRARTLVVEYEGQTWRFPLLEGQFPNTAGLWSDAEGRKHELPGGSICINPGLLATLAKVLANDGRKIQPGAGFTFTFTGDENRPVLVTYREHSSTFRALVMPVRVR
jgi:hypothetical protein